MKRHHRHHHLQQSSTAGGVPAGGDGTIYGGKAKIWKEEEDDDQGHGGGMDELLAVLGYKVKSTDMADVAKKLEQLEMAMSTAHLDDTIPNLSADTVHYNPSDLSNWVQSMLSELNHPLIENQVPPKSHNHDREQHKPSIFYEDRYDLSAIPGDAVYSKNEQVHTSPGSSSSTTGNCNKRMRTSVGSDFCELSSHQPSTSLANQSEIVGGEGELEAARSLVMVVNDSQETGVRLVHALLACAEAVQQDNLKVADALIKHIGLLAAAQVGTMRKVATYFAEALARRIYRIFPHEQPPPTCSSSSSSSYDDLLEMHFYDTCPYLKFAHFTANQAILETLGAATTAADKIHVIDFGLKQGMQWPALMQALALRPGGSPVFCLTGIVPPPPPHHTGNNGGDVTQQVGWKLAQVAHALGVRFEFKEFVAKSLADLEPSKLVIAPPEVETLVVNAVFELHRQLAVPESVEKVLAAVKAMKPKIVTVVEQEANHNGPVFLDRFTEALHYYSTLFDSLEGSGSGQDLVMSEMYLGRQICNVVSCEGAEREERHEPLTRWLTRMESAGFDPVHLGSNSFKQASMLLALFSGGDGYRVEERDGCLTLGWHTRPLIATSAWQPAAVNSVEIAATQLDCPF